MRMLQVGDRPTALARVLGELGRIIKTLHLLGYIDDEGRRRAILTQLNRHEARHQLVRAVCHGKRGEIREPHCQGQEEQLGVLGLVLNAIALWNATTSALRSSRSKPKASLSTRRMSSGSHR